MPKRKTQPGEDLDGDQSVPLPIQTFFWRQTSPFIRPKLGKLCDASCVSFERVVVQNILHGQPPSLCEALQSVSRWKVIQVSFPHVMHACAALLENRRHYNPGGKFSNSETKLLYTLHWIILDAASECEDTATVQDTVKPVGTVQLHTLKSIQLFVYLFAPLVNTLEDSDFQSLKLENGLRIWQPMWDYQQPDTPCFSTPVKPQRNILKAQRNLLKVNTNAANIYIGKGTSREDLNLMLGFDTGSMHSSDNSPSPTRLAPLARLSDSEFCFMSQSAHSETQSVSYVCEFCNAVRSNRSGEVPNVCKCGRKDSFVTIGPDTKQGLLDRLGSLDKDFMKNRLASAVTSGIKGPTAPDILSASYFDVSVLQCLFCLQWSEDGILWALKYFHHRLLEICDEYTRMDLYERERSQSLPFADPKILRSNSVPKSSISKSNKDADIASKTAESTKPKSASMSPGLSTIPSDSEPSSNPASPISQPFLTGLRKEPPFKKVCMVELRQYPDSTRAVVTRKDPPRSDASPTHIIPFKTRLDQYALPTVERDATSGLYKWNFEPGRSPSDSSTRSPSDKGTKMELSWASSTERSMSPVTKFNFPPPSDQEYETSSHSSNESSVSSQFMESSQSAKNSTVTRPIITITQETPQRTQQNWPARYAYVREQSTTSGEGGFERQHPGLSRSMTDSHITYQPEEEVHEAPGAVHYIQRNGRLNYKVILQAVHFVAKNQGGEKICEVLLNLINCLLDLDIIERKGDTEKKTEEKQKEAEQDGSGSKKESMTSFSLAMDSIVSVYKSLGCPHGCGDGLRGRHGDNLRQKGHGCLQRLQRINPPLFRSYMQESIKTRPIQEMVDFFHAFLGFCVDPVLILQASHSGKKSSIASAASGTGATAGCKSSSGTDQGHKKSVSQEALANNGFANNFGHAIGGVGYRGVEGVLMSNSMKTFVTRCVECARELYSSDNINLFCDIRQLIGYFKEIHGGTFRRVALSGLLDSYFDVKKKEEKSKEAATPTSHPISRTTSVTSESGDERDTKSPVPSSTASDTRDYGKGRKSIFKKKLIKNKNLMMQPYAASDSELQDELFSKRSPRASLSANEDEPMSGSNTPKRKFSKFHIGKGWRKPKSDHEEDSPSDSGILDRRESKSETVFHRGGVKGKMSFKTASQATLTFLSARKRIEGGLKNLGKKMSKHDVFKDVKQSLSEQPDEVGNEMHFVREKKLVDKFIIKSGMLRFNFLLECSHPGTVPDPQLVAAMLQLDAPVSARALLLLECAQFVHRCNRGDWPGWMRLNLPSFRHSSSALTSRGQPSGYRRTLNLQKAAGRMFYNWAENLGSQMEYIMAKEHANRLNVISEIQDENKRKQLRMEDDEEDFLDESIVNPNGTDCPYALKMLGCLVLQEITTFLRETFQYLPRSKKQKLDPGWDKHLSTRRWSSIVSSPGHSEKSSESNIADLPQSSPAPGVGSPGERKISFAVNAERSDSIHSSTTSISIDPLNPPHTPVEERKGRRLAQGRQKLLKHLRRGSTHNTSFRQNRSFRMKRGTEGGSIKLYGSIRSRKVSSQSLQSQEKFLEGEPSADDLESMTMFSEEVPEISEEQQEVDDEKMYQNMPWIRVVIQLANLSNFICPHQSYCHPNCYERQRRSCSRLITSVKKIYESTEEEPVKETDKKLEERRDMLKERLKRRQESLFQQQSPTKRRESTPLLDKIKSDVNLIKQKLGNDKKGDKPKEVKEELPIMKYITSQAQRLTQCPMGILTKAAPTLTEDNFIDIMPVAWELMLESDQELAAAAASLFLLSSVKAPEKAQTMVFKELQHEDTNQRINAVLRFGTLWRFRHQVWPRMEEGANLHFKVPPPNIDFTLPSPTIGLPKQDPVDPPWIPHFKAKIEEVTVNQEQTKSLVTATTTRRKQQQEMIRRALQHEEERKRVGRETFPMTTVSVTQLAAVEPSLHHVSEDHEEALQEELNLAARRVSLAPTNRNTIANRSLSWRNGSMHWARLTTFEGDEERLEHGHHVHLAQTFFPSAVCAVVLPIIHLLEDGEVGYDGVAVSEVAEKIIWNCLVEDPILFLRHFLEKLTHKDKYEELLFLLRKLVFYYRELPSQMGHSLFNYLIGYVMFYVRTPQPYGQDAMAGALALLWQIIPSVEGIYFKDLKQTLKKEQCDPNILISANVPSAKKIIVHGPDLTSIPSQFPIHEDTQFNVVLQDSLDFFNIPEDEQGSYVLVDTKSNQIHNMNCYVRDFYFFRRNFYPQLSLVHMNPEEASEKLQHQAFVLKFGEIGKVLFTMSVLQSTAHHQMQNHISFLHEELIKLPAFPRKALDAEFALYQGSLGNELFGLDTLHKYSWVKLMHTMFSLMTSSFNWSQDLLLFLNVINGCIILHSEDTSLLRYSLGVIINTSIHFKHIFSMNGFLYVMPTLLKVYSNNQPNPVLCGAIQFVCRQFYILHRKPFMLQMFGSVASILDLLSASTGLIDCSKVQPDCLFKLLLSLEKETHDSLSILELVQGEKPFKALDFCYENDPDNFSIMDVINMCVTVVAYAPDSFRCVQMLTVLENVLPRYLDHLKQTTNQRDNPPAARAEISSINDIGTSLKAALTSCEFFTRSMSLPQRHLEAEKSTGKDKNRGSPVETSVFYDEREDSHTRHMEEGRGRKSYYDQDDEDMQMRNEFRKPRDSLLNVVAEFYASCQPRLRELRKMLCDPSFRPPELLDHKSHNRLAEIAHTLLKLAPYDPETMACAGLQRYMTDILPITDWSQEAVRPALNLILRRLDRLFSKISKSSSLKRKCNWDAAANLLKGVFLTLRKFQYIAHLPHLKTLINVLISIVLSTSTGGPQNIMESLPGVHSAFSHCLSVVPQTFSSALVKLVAMQMQALGDQFSLEQICGGVAVFPSSDRSINVLVNFILPLCIRVGCGRRDTPKLRQMDINYALTVILNVLSPPAKLSSSHQNSSTKSAMHHLSISEHGRCSSFSHTNKNPVKYQGNELLIQTAYLGLEILMACFDKALAPEWHRVTKCIIDTSMKVCLPMWRFLDFVVTHRPSIFLLLQPFIQFKMMRVNCDTAQEYYIQQTVKDKLQGYSFTHPKCIGSVLVELALELKQIKEDFISAGGEYRSRSATMATERSDYSQTHFTDLRNKASVTEITAEIIGQPKPTLATLGKRASRATIFSQTSSNTSQPFKTTVVTTTVTGFDVDSPSGQRRISRRISAKDGVSILEKFRKPTLEDISPSEQHMLEASPKVTRKPTISFRAASAAQSSFEEQPPAEILYENEAEGEFPNGGEVITTGTTGTDLNPKEHRLQRQDAKSRKTFKMKRQKTKTTSVRRFMSHRGRNDTSDTESNSTESSPIHRGRRKRLPLEQEALTLHRTGTGTRSPRSGSPRTDHQLAKSVETIQESSEDPKPSRSRYIQRSKSHDDPQADIHAPAGTVRGRIARQGARIVRSRSPSSSPVRSARSPDAGTGSSSAITPEQEPAEVPVTVNYCGIPGAGSPPQSAKSVKDNVSAFGFSYKDSIRRYERKSPPISQDKRASHTSMVTQNAAESLAISQEPRSISPPSSVQAKIRQFNARDRQRPISPPAKDRYRPISPPRPAYSNYPPTPAPIPKPPTIASDKFRPKSEISDQKALKSPTSNGESGRFSPSSTTSESNYSSSSSVATIKASAPGAFGQAYVSSICSSDESLTESSSLLKDEEKITSPSALCIYFDKKGFPDTLV